MALEKQPRALSNLLSVVNASRRQSSLYGADHPNALRAAAGLSSSIDEFVAESDRTTFVFTRKALIANDRNYASSNDSQELFHRLRARGVMAVTLVGSAGPEQTAAFLGFLNAEPSGIREAGGASAYLRGRMVSRIVVTDAVYVSGSDLPDDSEDDTTSRAEWNSDQMDHAVGAAIEWLSRQEEEGEEAPRLPITDILSRPDKAAKLIREAVTKLHASRREETSGELASEVVHDLKDMASSDREKWDNSTPQIRKAISKLPKDIRPEISGFTEEDEPGDDLGADASCGAADIGEVEARVAEMLGDSRGLGGGERFPTPDAFGSLFGAKASGLLSSWRRELQPGLVMESSGKTLETLLIWEDMAAEHERLARALAGLIPRAIAMKDVASARMIAACLIGEMRRDDPLNWRASNVRSALAAVDVKTLKALVERAVAASDVSAQDTAAALVELLPDLALEAVDLLGSSVAQVFSESLRRGILARGPAAIGPLARVLRDGVGASRQMALEVLVDMKGAAAIREIAQAITGAEPEFIIRALKLLPAARLPLVTEICTAQLAHSAPEVRCAALAALGELGDVAAAPMIAQVALKNDDTAEKLQAISALGKIDCEEARDCLTKLANRRPLLGRSRYESIRAAAERALLEADSRRSGAKARAA